MSQGNTKQIPTGLYNERGVYSVVNEYKEDVFLDTPKSITIFKNVIGLRSIKVDSTLVRKILTIGIDSLLELEFNSTGNKYAISSPKAVKVLGRDEYTTKKQIFEELNKIQMFAKKASLDIENVDYNTLKRYYNNFKQQLDAKVFSTKNDSIISAYLQIENVDNSFLENNLESMLLLLNVKALKDFFRSNVKKPEKDEYGFKLESLNRKVESIFSFFKEKVTLYDGKSMTIQKLSNLTRKQLVENFENIRSVVKRNDDIRLTIEQYVPDEQSNLYTSYKYEMITAKQKLHYYQWLYEKVKNSKEMKVGMVHIYIDQCPDLQSIVLKDLPDAYIYIANCEELKRLTISGNVKKLKLKNVNPRSLSIRVPMTSEKVMRTPKNDKGFFTPRVYWKSSLDDNNDNNSHQIVIDPKVKYTPIKIKTFKKYNKSIKGVTHLYNHPIGVLPPKQEIVVDLPPPEDEDDEIKYKSLYTFDGLRVDSINNIIQNLGVRESIKLSNNNFDNKTEEYFNRHTKTMVESRNSLGRLTSLVGFTRIYIDGASSFLNHIHYISDNRTGIKSFDNIKHINLTGLPIKSLTNFPDIVYLNVKKCNMLNSIEPIPTLETLYSQKSGITSINLDDFPSLKKIKCSRMVKGKNKVYKPFKIFKEGVNIMPNVIKLPFGKPKNDVDFRGNERKISEWSNKNGDTCIKISAENKYGNHPIISYVYTFANDFKIHIV